MNQPTANTSSDLFKKLDSLLVPTVHSIERLTHNIIEITIHAPLAAKEFKPGQFYRLQNYESNSPKPDENTRLAMEGVALTGASVDKENGLVSLIVMETGGSTSLIKNLQVGERVVLMGPTGEATTIRAGETLLLAGGGLGNAVLFSIGKAFKEAGSRVLYFAAYRNVADRYKILEIEEASDAVVWCCDEKFDEKSGLGLGEGGEPAKFPFLVNRPQDKVFHGNAIEAMLAYARGDLGVTTIDMQQVDRIIAIGSPGMMNAVKEARRSVLQPYLNLKHMAIGSINSPMQCMMKEICAQCLQKHIDPETGEETFVYSCKNQDQCLDKVSFGHLNNRLKQNSLQEKITKDWIEFSSEN